MNIERIITDESIRHREFPVAAHQIYFAHAGVTALPRVAAQAIHDFADLATKGSQEAGHVWKETMESRNVAARLLGCDASEIALLGPTSLGLSLVANGLDWEPGDEVVCYHEDYPANVYPWMQLERLGVKVVLLQPEHPGAITWDTVEAALTPRTKLVTLATCNFLSGYRPDIETIGRNLRARNVLFCVDGIQTIGAFPISVEHVDFLSADSHKWMLGPAAAGIVYVKNSIQETLRPSLLGAWNVQSPDFVAQHQIDYYAGARRYEPGILNLPGIVGMVASMRLLLDLGIDRIAARILELRAHLVGRLHELGYELYLSDEITPENARSGIVTVGHPTRDTKADFDRLTAAGVAASYRANRAGAHFLRFSPHFYNTEAEIETVVDVLRKA